MARRSPGDGSLYQRRTDGLWVAQYQGEYRYSKDKATAKSKLRKLMTEADEVKPENITVGKYIDQWFDFAKPNLKPSTIKRYRESIEVHIKPNIGDTKLHKVEALTVQEMYAAMLRAGLSSTTVNIVHSVLSSAYKCAIKWRLVRHNIMADVDAPRIVRKEVEVFTPQEVRALLSAASGNHLEGVYVLALSTGMRGGEILALQRPDVSMDAGILQVRRTLILNGSGIGTPKSKNSYRTIQLPQVALDALERHTNKNGASLWLFPGKSGQNLRYHSFIRFQWKRLVEYAGIDYKCFHTCRHYVASELLRKGIPISAVARYLGDNEVTILRTYSHLIDGMQNMAASAMDEALG
jgi:integrase